MTRGNSSGRKQKGDKPQTVGEHRQQVHQAKAVLERGGSLQEIGTELNVPKSVANRLMREASEIGNAKCKRHWLVAPSIFDGFSTLTFNSLWAHLDREPTMDDLVALVESGELNSVIGIGPNGRKQVLDCIATCQRLAETDQSVEVNQADEKVHALLRSRYGKGYSDATFQSARAIFGGPIQVRTANAVWTYLLATGRATSLVPTTDEMVYLVKSGELNRVPGIGPNGRKQVLDWYATYQSHR